MLQASKDEMTLSLELRLTANPEDVHKLARTIALAVTLTTAMMVMLATLKGNGVENLVDMCMELLPCRKIVYSGRSCHLLSMWRSQSSASAPALAPS